MTPTEEPTMKMRFSQRGTLAVVCLATAMLMLDIAVVNTALSHIATDLHSSLSGLQWIVDAYTLALATVVLTAGSVADRLGRRRVYAWGMGGFTVTSLVLALLRANEDGWGSTAIVAELVGAAALYAAFVAAEWRAKEPMLPLQFFRRPAFTGAQIAAFAISASFFALFLYTTLYLQEIL